MQTFLLGLFHYSIPFENKFNSNCILYVLMKNSNCNFSVSSISHLLILLPLYVLYFLWLLSTADIYHIVTPINLLE